MAKKLYPVLPINKNYGSIRIQIDKEMGAQPGKKYWQKRLPGGIILLIPEDICENHEDELFLKLAEKNRENLELINSELDKITDLVRGLK